MIQDPQVMLMVGPERKARIKSYFEHALRGSPRRWAYVVPAPRGGAIRGIANSWADALAAVLRHIDGMYGEETSNAGRHHRAAGGGGTTALHHPGEAKGAPYSVVSPPGRGRHAGGPLMGASVGPPPARDPAFAALARPAERPGHGAVAASELIRRLTDPDVSMPLGAKIEEMRRSGAVR